ncbi:MAG: metallophosphoesterase [Bacilli bacterium]
MEKGASPIRIFAIADLHLSFGVAKPMSVFGEAWAHHTERLAAAWMREVGAQDTVLIAGDISWAMREEEVQPDLEFVARLPGRKVLLKGNHDYWWSTRKKVARLAGPGCGVLQTNALLLPQAAIVGARGWNLPSSPQFTPDDGRILAREVDRLRLSLEEGRRSGLPLIAMMHYPPLYDVAQKTVFTDLLESYGVRVCVYGHLHGTAHRSRVEGVVRGIRYHLVSADYLEFTPLALDLHEALGGGAASGAQGGRGAPGQPDASGARGAPDPHDARE